MKLFKRSAGRYSTTVRLVEYLVEHHDSGWRWTKGGDPSVGGEWRATKREAALDLAAYLCL